MLLLVANLPPVVPQEPEQRLLLPKWQLPPQLEQQQVQQQLEQVQLLWLGQVSLQALLEL